VLLANIYVGALRHSSILIYPKKRCTERVNHALSKSDYTVSNCGWLINNQSESTRKWLWPKFSYYRDTWPERLRKTMKNLKNTIFWDITPCSPLSVDRRFGGTYRLHLQGRKIRWARNQRESRWLAELTSVSDQAISLALPAYCITYLKHTIFKRSSVVSRIAPAALVLISQHQAHKILKTYSVRDPLRTQYIVLILREYSHCFFSDAFHNSCDF
jgi:hypothetical protein